MLVLMEFCLYFEVLTAFIGLKLRRKVDLSQAVIDFKMKRRAYIELKYPGTELNKAWSF